MSVELRQEGLALKSIANKLYCIAITSNRLYFDKQILTAEAIKGFDKLILETKHIL